MQYYSVQIMIEKEDSGGYSARCPNLPGCFSNGSTIEATKLNIREAILLHLESLRARNRPVDLDDRLVHVEEMTFALEG